MRIDKINPVYFIVIVTSDKIVYHRYDNAEWRLVRDGVESILESQWDIASLEREYQSFIDRTPIEI